MVYETLFTLPDRVSRSLSSFANTIFFFCYLIEPPKPMRIETKESDWVGDNRGFGGWGGDGGVWRARVGGGGMDCSWFNILETFENWLLH